MALIEKLKETFSDVFHMHHRIMWSFKREKLGNDDDSVFLREHYIDELSEKNMKQNMKPTNEA